MLPNKCSTEYAQHAAQVGEESGATEEDHLSSSGDYSDDALAAGSVSRVSLRNCGWSVAMLADSSFAGGLVHKHGQWLAVRVTNDHVWLLDSCRRPVQLGTLVSSAVQSRARQHECVFPVRRTTTNSAAACTSAAASPMLTEEHAAHFHSRAPSITVARFCNVGIPSTLCDRRCGGGAGIDRVAQKVRDTEGDSAKGDRAGLQHHVLGILRLIQFRVHLRQM